MKVSICLMLVLIAIWKKSWSRILSVVFPISQTHLILARYPIQLALIRHLMWSLIHPTSIGEWLWVRLLSDWIFSAVAIKLRWSVLISLVVFLIFLGTGVPETPWLAMQIVTVSFGMEHLALVLNCRLAITDSCTALSRSLGIRTITATMRVGPVLYSVSNMALF